MTIMLQFINHSAIRQLMLKQKGFLMLKSPLVTSVAMSHLLIVFNCFLSICYFCFAHFILFKMFWTYSFDTLLRSFEINVYP